MVENQMYGNCGPEMIENFIWWLTEGYRLSQEDAVAIHSAIVEEDLLKEYQAYQDAMKAERGAILVKAFQNKNFMVNEKLSAQINYYIQEGGVFETLRQFLGFGDSAMNEHPLIQESENNEHNILSAIEEIMKYFAFDSQYLYEM